MAPHGPEERVQRRLAAILAADVVGYSRLMEQDDHRVSGGERWITLEALRDHFHAFGFSRDECLRAFAFGQASIEQKASDVYDAGHREATRRILLETEDFR